MKPVIEFKPVDPKGPGILAELGDGFATPSVDGGWAVVARDSRVGITEFQGTNPITMDIPIMFDGLAHNRSVEHLVNAIQHVMRSRVGKRAEPAVIELRRFPAPYRHLQWVITGIAHGEEVRRERDGLRIRAALTVTVMEYVVGDVLIKKKSPAQRTAQKD